MEAHPRRPVLADHPCVVAAVAVLRDAGEPLGITDVFARAHERGLLPASAAHTVRARLAAHARTPNPVVVPLPKRKGWTLACAPEDATASPGGCDAGLRHVTLTLEALRAARGRAGKAPPTLARYVEAVGEVPLKAAVLGATDAALEWLFRAFPFPPELSERIRVAGGGLRGRACVLAVEEHRREAAERATARRVVRVRVAGKRAGKAVG